MSDIMKSIPFGQLMEWILEEHKKQDRYLASRRHMLPIRQKQLKYLAENWRIR